MISLDTNILVYATDRKNADDRHRISRRIVDSAEIVKIALAGQAIVEFVHVATRKTKLPLHEVAPYVRLFRRNFELLFPSGNVIDDVLDLLRHYNLSVWDAHLVAVCNAHGCTHLLSEDLQDGARYGTVTVVDPFDPANAAAVESLFS